MSMTTERGQGFKKHVPIDVESDTSNGRNSRKWRKKLICSTRTGAPKPILSHCELGRRRTRSGRWILRMTRWRADERFVC
jgi:hypothetical protein